MKNPKVLVSGPLTNTCTSTFDIFCLLTSLFRTQNIRVYCSWLILGRFGWFCWFCRWFWLVLLVVVGGFEWFHVIVTPIRFIALALLSIYLIC